MKRLPLAALCLALLGAGPAARSIAPATFVPWEAGGAGSSVRAAGLVATNATRACPAKKGAGEPGCTVPVAVLADGTGREVELAGAADGTVTTRLGIGMLDHGRAGVILSGFSGGAHCCESYRVAMPAAGGGWRVLTLSRTEATDAGPVRQTDFDYGLAGFPTDLDGDGRADFVMGDDAFAYAFTDYADSRTPPVVLTVVGPDFADVSRRPGFRRLFAADLVGARHDCVAPEPQRSPNGACAAYAADAARLGRFDSAWAEIVSHYDRSQDGPRAYPRCTAAYAAGRCPAGHEVSYPDYPTALRAFLVRTGYIAR